MRILWDPFDRFNINAEIDITRPRYSRDLAAPGPVNQALGGLTIHGSRQDAAQSISLRTDAASARADSTRIVRESLEAQRSAISGISVAEESIRLLTYQRQYQGAARFISVVAEMTQTLISLI